MTTCITYNFFVNVLKKLFFHRLLFFAALNVVFFNSWKIVLLSKLARTYDKQIKLKAREKKSWTASHLYRSPDTSIIILNTMTLDGVWVNLTLHFTYYSQLPKKKLMNRPVNSKFFLLLIQVNDDIMLTTTDYNAWHTEVFRITAISGTTITVNDTIKHKHIG